LEISTADTRLSFSFHANRWHHIAIPLRHTVVTLRDEDDILGSKTDFFNSNILSENSTSHEPFHLKHAGPDQSNRENVGLPKVWQRILEDNGISKFDQEKIVMGIVKSYHGNVWDRMGHAPAPGGSRSPPIPGAVHATYPRVSESVDDTIGPWVPQTFNDNIDPGVSKSFDDNFDPGVAKSFFDDNFDPGVSKSFDDSL
jgi:hypothetical protein